MKEAITATENGAFIDHIAITEKRGNTLVNIMDISWFEADANYVKIHTATTTYIKKLSLKELELQLDPTIFARIHRSTIISLNSVESIFPYFKEEYIIVLKNEKLLRMSRTYLNKLPLIREKVQQKEHWKSLK